MKHFAIKYIIYGHICFFISLAIMVAIFPSGLSANDGISFYSYQLLTVIPYFIGLLGCSFLTFKATRHFPNRSPLNLLGKYLRICAILLVCLTLAIDIPKTPIAILHVIFGSALFSLELLISFWLAFLVKPNFLNKALALIELSAGIVCLISLINFMTFQIHAQIIFIISFAILLIRSVNALVRD